MADTQSTRGLMEFHQEGARVVRATGEFGIENTARLGGMLDRVLDKGDPVVLDLAAMKFMDSTALSGVLAALKRAWGTGQTLLLSGPLQPTVATLFSVTGVTRFVTVHENLPAAIAAISAPRDTRSDGATWGASTSPPQDA